MFCGLTLFAANALCALEPVQELDPVVIRGGFVAHELPLPTYANPISLLGFDPRVEIQSRNFAEAQGDITVRGGIFENTGVIVGKLNVFDPQTGHYVAELPIDPSMLLAPEILTGQSAQRAGVNASVASLRYGWAPIRRTGGMVSLAAGRHGLNTQSFYQSLLLPCSPGERGVDVGYSRSSSDGPIPGGDHDFQRVSVRMSGMTERVNWTLFGGYQDKFFGWPNLYTPFGVQETESIQTMLLVAESEWRVDSDTRVEWGLFYRKNRDDYEFDRFRPGLFNPYEHETELSSIRMALARDGLFGIDWEFLKEFHFDTIESTALAHSFHSRTYRRVQVAGAIPDWRESMNVGFHVGVRDTNRESASFESGLRIDYRPISAGGSSNAIWYVDYTGASQVPGYTALGSPTSGLFGGNPHLGVERSHQFELGYRYALEDLHVSLAVFYRMDRSLTDWTFSFGGENARSAHPVDLNTAGLEWLAQKTWEKSAVSIGYTFLDKKADYRDSEVDASFYALNFPTHRLTLSIDHALTGHWRIRWDNEFRVQYAHPLREGSENAGISYLSIEYQPKLSRQWFIEWSVMNLWNDSFETLPAVPASPRMFALRTRIAW